MSLALELGVRMQLEVAPQALTAQAPEITRQGARLAEVAGELRGLAGVAGWLGGMGDQRRDDLPVQPQGRRGRGRA